ncbi:MAG: efflux RND transporter periplasmic adaptor subunit [Gammaproteobacteria bacterium]|nr:MAG: efflux RND transporter periplasmic adaptor subunit [Gammaproteobacteria bacterium]
MMQSAKTGTSVVVGIVLGVAASTLVFFNLERGDAASGADTNATGRDKPLYWVAPMDPDYRRDKPGKSPMGMDLVPVYATGGGGVDAGPGTIEISPEVVNNLGVRTARVERRTLTTRIRTVGYVQYDEDRLIHIHPRVEGWIEKLYVKAAGDPVVQGQPLYELYSPQLVNAQEEMLLSLKRNNNRLVQAAQDRLLALQLSTSFIDELKRERQVRQTITFRAPQSGVVDNLNIREGFFVQPGTTLMSIGALDDVWVEAEVFARQAALVEVGLPVVMTLNYLPGKEWRGSVDYVYPSLDEKTRTLRIRLRFNNTAGMLKPNMFAQVFIEAGRGGDALMVPREAVIRTGSQDRVVLALGDGRFKSVAVRLGQLDEQYTQILEGLEEGDKVVVSAQFLLDSESSKSAGFMRMQLGDTEDSSMLETAADSHLQRTGADHD